MTNRELAEKITEKWWCGPPAVGKVDLVEELISEHVATLTQQRDDAVTAIVEAYSQMAPNHPYGGDLDYAKSVLYNAIYEIQSWNEEVSTGQFGER